MSDWPKDFMDQPLNVGDRVARAYRRGNSGAMEIRIVMRVERGRVYLDGSHVPVVRTDNLLILHDD